MPDCDNAIQPKLCCPISPETSRKPPESICHIEVLIKQLIINLSIILNSIIPNIIPVLFII